MTNKQICAALKCKGCTETQFYFQVYKLLTEVKTDIVNVALEKTAQILSFGGVKYYAAKVTIETNKGNYNFIVPTANDFFYALCDLLGVKLDLSKPIIKLTNEFLISSEVLKAISKCKNFVSKDNLRPAMTGVCLHIKKDSCKVVATDAHKLYKSKDFDIMADTDIEDLKIVIDKAIFDKIKSIAASEDLIIGYNDTHIYFNGVECNLIDARYPDYEIVVPQLDKAMVFNNEKMQGLCKYILPCTNGATNQITFHLNGSIAAMGCDVDFSFESSTQIDYISKDFEDLDISFNGKFMLNCLQVFDKKSNIKMLHSGKKDKPAIFTNDVESVLLMPLCLNK